MTTTTAALTDVRREHERATAAAVDAAKKLEREAADLVTELTSGRGEYPRFSGLFARYGGELDNALGLRSGLVTALAVLEHYAKAER